MKGCIAAFGICFVMARVGGMRGMVRVCNIRFRVRNYAVRLSGQLVRGPRLHVYRNDALESSTTQAAICS
jgi:hypothetical protein